MNYLAIVVAADRLCRRAVSAVSGSRIYRSVEMMQGTRWVAAAGVCLVAGASAVNAASLSFDFTQNGVPTGTGAKPTYAFTSGGVTVNVTGQTSNAARTEWTSTDVKVYRTTANGLGVQSPGPDNVAQLDAIDSNERLLFNFSADVSVLSITFKNSGTNDKAVVGLFDGVTDTQIQSFLLGGQPFVKAVSIPVPNAKFLYLAAIPSLAAPSTATDWFSVASMTAQTGLVPVPASVWSGLALVGLLGVMRGRSRRASVIA